MSETRDDYDLTRHRRRLKARETEIRATLSRAPHRDIGLLSRELAAVRRLIADGEPAYLDARRTLAQRAASLSRMHNMFPADDLEAARRALASGDGRRADVLFAEAEAQLQEPIDRAADAAHQRALHARDEVRLDAARRHVERALRLAPERHAVLKDAAQIFGAIGDARARLRLEQRTAEAARVEFGEDSPERAESLARLAQSLHESGRHAEAEPLYLRAIDIERANLGDDHPDIAARLNNLANLYRDMGRRNDAERLLLKAVSIGEGMLGEDHPEYAVWVSNLAGLRRAQGRLDEAEALMRKALEITRAAFGDWHPSTAIRLNNLAGLLRARGQRAEAETHYKRAIEIDGQTLGEDHVGYGVDLNNLAALYESMRREIDAERLYAQASRIFIQRLGPNHPTTRLAQAGQKRAASRARRRALSGVL